MNFSDFSGLSQNLAIFSDITEPNQKLRPGSSGKL